MAQSTRHSIAEFASANQGNAIEYLDVIFENRAGSVQRADRPAERTEHDATRWMDVANGLHVGPRFVDSCVDPKFCIRPAIAGELIAFNVEHEQVVFTDKRGTHSRRKNICVGSRNTRADMAESGGDPLLVQNMAGGNDVLLEMIEIHARFRLLRRTQLPYARARQMSMSQQRQLHRRDDR